MKAVIQRVKKAKITINGSKEKNINKGIVIFIGIGEDDARKDADWLSEKIMNLRIFPNDEGKLDQSITAMAGEIMIVSQFTLFADVNKGRRPDFTKAAKPEKAIPLYEYFIKSLEKSKLKIETGEFGANMLVEIHNDGPVTINLDTKELKLYNII